KVPPAIGGAVMALDCDVRKAPVVKTLSCRLASFTVVVGISVSVARTVVWRQAVQLAPNASSKRSAVFFERPFIIRKSYCVSVGSLRASCSPGPNAYAVGIPYDE